MGKGILAYVGASDYADWNTACDAFNKGDAFIQEILSVAVLQVQKAQKKMRKLCMISRPHSRPYNIIEEIIVSTCFMRL